jgi:hypothetical protein
MTKKSLLKRIEHLEMTVKARSWHPESCTCFPRDETPFFGFPIEGAIAFGVKCPLHGDRFHHESFFIFVPTWRRKNEVARRLRLSSQYRKAWDAGFPLNLWPAEEEETEDGKIFLKLKDGTRLLAYEPRYSRPESARNTIEKNDAKIG